jgi:hypothetical protein
MKYIIYIEVHFIHYLHITDNIYTCCSMNQIAVNYVYMKLKPCNYQSQSDTQ